MRVARIVGGSSGIISPDIVGSKASNLARMATLGLPIPPAFVMPTELCADIIRGDSEAERRLDQDLAEGISFLEGATGRVFGDRRRPLLVSVRSSAARSMPGMLETVLNVGCTTSATRGLLRMTGNPRFAWDCRCRFLKSYGAVVLGLSPAAFARPRDALVTAEGTESEETLDNEALERLASQYQQAIEDAGYTPPDDPFDQLTASARMVYRSWTSDRARTYRRLEHLENLGGTAVTVQAMVFGNRGLSSGAGVAFSRDPSTGAATPVIEVLFGSQGEDVVSGRRTPDTEQTFLRVAPAAAPRLDEALDALEREFRDVQDVEFTIENGTLWILQTRAAKRTPQAALRFAVDFVKAGLITQQEALHRLDGFNLDAIADRRLIGTDKLAGLGIGASAGVAVGRAAFDSASATRLAENDPVILVRPDTSTADVAGFAASDGIITAAGGRTAHAALIARQMGKPCIVGCPGLVIDVMHHRAQLAGITIEEGDWLSIDGSAGTIHLGRSEIVSEKPEAALTAVKLWRSTIASR